MERISGKQIRSLIIELSKQANVGHIGSALSISDIIAELFNGTVKLIATKEADRDRFVLSKGHAALALYAAMYLRNVITKPQLDTYCQNGTLLGTHPEHVLPGIDFSTGSLGQGLSIGAGAALAARINKSSRRVFVLVSDAECNEGSVWEGVMFAAHHRLSQLTVIVDNNGQQAMGYTKDILDQQHAADRWGAFGWNVLEIDGHNSADIYKALQIQVETPTVIIANTSAGKGVSFMERQVKWHYLPLDNEQYIQALTEIEAKQ